MYELEKIESVVKEVLCMPTSANRQLDENSNLAAIFKSEVDRIQKSFVQHVLSDPAESHFKRYFHFHQIRIIQLLDILFQKHIPSDDDSLISSLLRSVEELLTFLKTQFPTYFDDSAIAPLCFQQTMLKQIQVKMRDVQPIANNEFLEPEIFNIAVEPLISPIEAGQKRLTYRRLSYLGMLQSELLSMDFSIKDRTWIRVSLCNMLIAINYNDASFFSYYTNHIKNAQLTCETLADRIDQTAYFQKSINQVVIRPGARYDPSLSDVKDQLLQWSGFELDYLREKSFLQSSAKDSTGISKDYKIVFNLSVAQLAYVFRMFVDNGIIQNKNTSELIRFLSKFVKTKKAESVSYESLRIKYYNTEIGTKDAVRKIFQSLLSYMNKS